VAIGQTPLQAESGCGEIIINFGKTEEKFLTGKARDPDQFDGPDEIGPWPQANSALRLAQDEGGQ
jgi:hypothetical protein